MRINILKSAAVAAAVISTGSHADEFHYNNTLIGDRASGMGGAYTAIADDPSGLYYNPAGLVYTGKKNFSASVNAFNYTLTTYNDVLGGGDWTRTSSNLLPNFFGVTQPLFNGTIGFSYAVTDSILEDQSQYFNNFGNTSDFYINVNNSDNVYKVGPSYSYPLSNNFSVGLTLYGHYRKRDFITNQWIRKTDNSFEWSNIYYKSTEYGINPVLGLMWSPIDKLSLGLTLRQTYILNTERTQQSTCITDIATNTASQCQTPLGTIDPSNPKDPSKAEDTTNRELPFTVNTGFAFFPNNSLLISGDFSYYGETDDGKVATWNTALGAEYYLDSTWAMRAGFFTNNSNSPAIESGGVNQNDHVNIYGGSFSLSRFTRTSSITGGISFSYGTGDAQVVSGSTAIQEVSVLALNLYLSTSYTY